MKSTFKPVAKLGPKGGVVVVALLLLTPCIARGGAWKQQFGPARNNVVPSEVAGKLANEFADGNISLIWQSNVGFGVAPVVVAGGKVYCYGFYNTGSTPQTLGDAKSAPSYDEVRNATFWGKPAPAAFDGKNLPGTPTWNRENHTCLRGEDWVQCLDAASGHQIWATKVSDFGLVYNNHQSFALASPLVDGSSLFVHTNTGRLYCLNSLDGKLLWNINLYDHGMYNWSEKQGNGCSPLRVGDNVIVSYLGRLESQYENAGGTTVTIVAAFDGRTGKEVWVTKTPCYCFRAMNTSIGFAEIDGVSTVLVPCGAGTVGIDAKTGAIVWKYVEPRLPKSFWAPYPAYTPIVWNNYVVDVWSDTHDSEFSETRVLKIQDGQARLAWNSHEFVPMSEIKKGNFIAVDGKLYGADAQGGWGNGDPSKMDGELHYRKYRGDDIGQFQCRDVATGKLLWHTNQFRPPNVKPWGWPGEMHPYNFLIAGDTMVLINCWGLWVAKLGETGATTLAHEDLKDEEGVRPVLVDGRLFIRVVDMRQNKLAARGNLLVFDLRPKGTN